MFVITNANKKKVIQRWALTIYSKNNFYITKKEQI